MCLYIYIYIYIYICVCVCVCPMGITIIHTFIYIQGVPNVITRFFKSLKNNKYRNKK